MSHWVKTSTDVDCVSHDAALAASVAKEKSGQIATLILPADVLGLAQMSLHLQLTLCP
jgi:hypothetical protein